MKNATIKLTEKSTPMGGASIYRADFRTLPLSEIEAINQDTLQGYASAGYNSFTFCRATGTISIRKLEIRSLEDVFDTDIYGLLS